MGSYKMNVNAVKKEMNLMVEGNFSPEQAAQFIKDYQQHTKRIKASDYVLRLDCTGMNVVTPELQPALEECCRLYKSSEFKNVVFEIAPKSASIVRIQLNRILRTTQLKADIVAV